MPQWSFGFRDCHHYLPRQYADVGAIGYVALVKHHGCYVMSKQFRYRLLQNKSANSELH